MPNKKKNKLLNVFSASKKQPRNLPNLSSKVVQCASGKILEYAADSGKEKNKKFCFGKTTTSLTLIA